MTVALSTGNADLSARRWLSSERIVCNVLADQVGNATLRVSSNAGVDWSDVGKEQDIIGESLIERVQPINVEENIILSSILLSSKESLVTLVGSFPTSVGYVSIGQEVMSY